MIDAFVEASAVEPTFTRLMTCSEASEEGVIDVAEPFVRAATFHIFAVDGLRRVAPDAVPLLAPVQAIAATRRTQADRMIELWNRHAGDRPALIAALAHPGLG